MRQNAKAARKEAYALGKNFGVNDANGAKEKVKTVAMKKYLLADVQKKQN